MADSIAALIERPMHARSIQAQVRADGRPHGVDRVPHAAWRALATLTRW
jgi:hypothetical protein